MDSFDVYNDIKARTGGDIYIGVVGPVRTGKSTFIKRFMDMLVIPGIEDEYVKERAVDELPQSSSGTTIMTTEPKFIPKEAALIKLSEDCELRVRLIDCVGFMVNGATGYIENEQERLVNTPWSKDKIPFSKAAEIGTGKVINDHSTIGIVITTDGSIGNIDRENYIEAEDKAITELKAINKPFIVLVNSTKPFHDDTLEIAESIRNKHNVKVITVNCEQLRKDDVTNIMKNVLMEFSVTRIDFSIPKWVEMLPLTHEVKKNLIENVKRYINRINILRDLEEIEFACDSTYIETFHISEYSPKDGKVHINVMFDESYYYQIISELVGLDIEDEYELIRALKELAAKKHELEALGNAFEKVNATGYGVVIPEMKNISIEEPEIIRHGNKYGVKIKAVAPSIHMIKANIETEIAPIVGNEELAKDLIHYMNTNENEDEEGIWNTNIFGKTIKQLVKEGVDNKINNLSDESQIKLQDTLQKVINDSNGGIVCIII